MRISAKLGVILCVVGLSASTDAAPPKGKPTQAPVKTVDADKLPPGKFIGTIVSPPDSERMFTLKITYPEVRLKPGARMPNLRNAHVQNMHRGYQQLIHLQQQLNRSAHHHHAVHNMMQMRQAFMQMQMNQQRAMQTMARIQQQQLQQELKLLQQEIKAIQNMYQVVKVTHDFVFQADENVKVRMKDVPEQFDEKGNIKKYTREELAALKGKDKNLVGYESSVEALKPGQIVLVTLRAHHNSKSSKMDSLAASKNDNKDKEKDSNRSLEHKMQVKMLVILKDDGSLTSSHAPAKNKK